MKNVNTQARIRVAHVSSVHPWTDNRIHYRECVSLEKMGYDVHLVAVESPIDGPKSAVAVTVLPRLPRIQRVTLGTIRAVKKALQTKATLFHLHDPELVWAIPVLRILGKRVVFDAHEDLPVQVLNKEYIPSLAKPFMKVAAHTAVVLAKLSNHVIAATETIAERFEEGRVTVVHNYPPLREVESSASLPQDRDKNLVYVGGMGLGRGAAQMIDALAEPNFPEGWGIDIAGSIPQGLLEELKLSPGWARVDYRGLIGPQEARDLALASRVGMLLYQDTPAHRDALPTKMFEYFAAGVPVIASNFPLWQTIVEKYDCGLLVDEKSPSAIAAAVSRYENDPSLLERHSNNARTLAVEMLNWAHEEPMLKNVYDRVLAK